MIENRHFYGASEKDGINPEQIDLAIDSTHIAAATINHSNYS